jgi:hypothetical protein
MEYFLEPEEALRGTRSSSRAAALVAAVLLFVALRHHVGDWIQARLFMATDFDDVSIRDIRRVKPEADERGPVHFVETIVPVRQGQGRLGSVDGPVYPPPR